jgi:DNA polymerase elongation subunit (family B)
MKHGEHEHLARLADAQPEVGRRLTAFARLQQASEGRTRDGKPFVDVVVADQSATLAGKIWGSDHPRVVKIATELPIGTPIKMLFEVRSYRGTTQLTLLNIRKIEGSEEGYEPSLIFGAGVEQVADLSYRTLVFDIETVPAAEVRKLPPTIARALATSAERSDSDESKVMSLSPLFGKVVSVAIGDGESPPGEEEITALVVPPVGREEDEYPDWIRPMSEAQLLSCFWHLASTAELIVTYNGRGFDVPFMVMRSLIHGVPPKVDLISNRFSLRPHLDLYDVLQPRRGLGPGSLDVMCWALGITSPKDVMDGSMVAPAYGRGEIETIATYNVGDVRATSALYQHVRDTLLPFRNDW